MPQLGVYSLRQLPCSGCWPRYRTQDDWTLDGLFLNSFGLTEIQLLRLKIHLLYLKIHFSFINLKLTFDFYFASNLSDTRGPVAGTLCSFLLEKCNLLNIGETRGVAYLPRANPMQMCVQGYS